MEEKPEDTNTIPNTDIHGPENWEQKLKENEKTVPPQDIEIVPADHKDPSPIHTSVGFWFFLLLIAFCISAVCGVYLSVKPGMTCQKEETSADASFAFKKNSKNKKEAGLAWIKVRGVIEEEEDSSPFSRPSSASSISKRIREAAKDERVKAIVLDINSPGGTVASVQDIYSEILRAKEQGKKVVALFRDVAASGAFYIAMAADQIVAEPGTITGSVGVIMQAGNVVGLFDKLGIQMTPITSGKYKDIGSAYRQMTEAEKNLLQDMVNDTYSQFLAAVKEGRPNVAPDILAEYTDGRVFTGQRAYNLGFIDKLGGEETAKQLAGELAGLKDPKIISQKKDSLRDFIFSFSSDMESKSLPKQLQTLSTPSVSYLWVF